jgi:hypothetical protein
MTVFVPQRPSLSVGGVTPTFTQCTAADSFAAVSGTYLLYYKNAGTPTTTLWVLNTNITTPVGSTPAVPTGATNWEDVLISAALGSSTDRAFVIEDVGPYVSSGSVNLKHNTPTSLTLAIFGPY